MCRPVAAATTGAHGVGTMSAAVSVAGMLSDLRTLESFVLLVRLAEAVGRNSDVELLLLLADELLWLVLFAAGNCTGLL